MPLAAGGAPGMKPNPWQPAVTIMERVGYNPSALVEMLGEMKRRWQPGGLGFARTHPDPQDRIDDIRGAVAGHPEVSEPATRHQRFVTALGDAS